jgi:hypothetical protein
MRLALAAFAAVGFSVAAPAIAHPDHEEARPQRRPIGELARESVVRLVTQAKLPATWTRARVVGTNARQKNGAQQFVVTFQNDAERNRARRTLYVLMTPTGDFISANYRLN